MAFNPESLTATERQVVLAGAYIESKKRGKLYEQKLVEYNKMASVLYNLEGVRFSDLPVLMQKLVLLTSFVALFRERWRASNPFGKVGLLIKSIKELWVCLDDVLNAYMLPGSDSDNAL